MPINTQNQTVTCDECGETFTREQVEEDIIRFHRRRGQLLCELCTEDHDEPYIDACIDRLEAEG